MGEVASPVINASQSPLLVPPNPTYMRISVGLGAVNRYVDVIGCKNEQNRINAFASTESRSDWE